MPRAVSHMSNDSPPAGHPAKLHAGDGARLLAAFPECRVLIVGDLMVDEYLMGDAERISPEAPVPVVLVAEDKRLLGGAGNVARNIRALGGQPFLVGVCGKDAAGLELSRCLAEDDIEAELFTLHGRPTTTKTRILARQQQIVRVDREDTSPLDDMTVSDILRRIARELPRCHAIVISDYGKGLVSSSLVSGLLALVHGDGRHLPVLVDPKPQNIGAYRGVTLLTPNAKETSEAVRLPVKTREQILAAGRAFMKATESPHLVTTLGPQGMAVFHSPDEVWHIPTTALQVFDVTGAGDTVIAATALSLAANAPLVRACIFANYAAGIVVGEVGAAVATPEQITHALATLPLPLVERWL